MYFEGKWYKKIILSYVIIFLIPMLVNIGLLEKNKVSDREEYGKEICANLEITVQWMDNNLREIDNIIEILQKDTNLKWIANYMKPEKKYSEFTRITEAEKLCERVSYTTVTDEFYVYLDKPKIILSSNRVFMDSEQDNNYFFRYEEDEKFMEMLQSPKYVNTILPSRVTIQNGKTVDQMVYVRSMLDHNAKKIGTFVFPVQSRKFKEILEKAVLPEQGWIYLENADGETVLETESESEIGTLKKLSPEIFREREIVHRVNSDNQIVTAVRLEAEHSGISATAVIPEQIILKSINEKQKIFVWIMIAVTCMGGVLIFWNSWWRGRELTGILRQNRGLAEKIKAQEPTIRALLIEKLLKSDENTVASALKNLQEYQIHIPENKCFATVVFEFSTKEEIPNVRNLELYQGMLHEKLCVIFAEEDMFECIQSISRSVVLLTVNPGIDTLINCWDEKLRKLITYFENEHGMILNIMVSDICRSVTEIYKTYDEVIEMTKPQKTDESGVCYYGDWKKQRWIYYYPITLEERLVNAVAAGDRQMLHDQLKQVYEVNVLERNLSSSMMHFLINNMQSTLFKILQSMNASGNIEMESVYGKIEETNKEKDLLQRFQQISGIFQELCEKTAESENENDETLFREIADYIEKNYGSHDLGLGRIAEQFGYESSYFSKLFKNLFGEKFVSYLERIRITRACELLKTDMTQERIADIVGYNSVYVFRTAFKRQKGCTPGEWKKINQ